MFLPDTPTPSAAAIRFEPSSGAWAGVESLVTAPSRAALAQVLNRLLREAGYRHVVCLLVPSATAAGAHEPRPTVLLDTRPAAWIKAYDTQNCGETDPFVIEGCRRIDPITWHDVIDAVPAARLSPAVTLAHAFGMEDGLIVPVMTDDGRIGLVIAAGRDVDRRPAAFRTVTIAAIIAFQRLLALRHATAPRPAELLSARESEVLHWIMVGKSDWQIGQILSISAKTVNYHVENVKRKFGVATRMQAVVAALRHQMGAPARQGAPAF